MHLRHLTSVDGEIVHDLDPEQVGDAVARVYLRDGVTADDAALLARAGTYRAALFEERIAGAAVTIRPRLIDTADETMARLQAEVAPLDEAGVLHLSAENASPASGVVAAVEHWFGGLDGRRIVIRGYDDLGAEIARGLTARGGRLAGVSNISGAVATGAGLSVEAVEEARAEHGDLFVTRLGLELHLPDELLDLDVDALVLAGAVGSVDAELASRISAAVVVPASDAPYTEGGLDRLRRRRIVPLPDVATTAGPFLEATGGRGLTPAETRARAERMIGERIEGARRSKVDPMRYVATLAETFLTTWIPAEIRPDGPPVRSDPSLP